MGGGREDRGRGQGRQSASCGERACPPGAASCLETKDVKEAPPQFGKGRHFPKPEMVMETMSIY